MQISDSSDALTDPGPEAERLCLVLEIRWEYEYDRNASSNAPTIMAVNLYFISIPG